MSKARLFIILLCCAALAAVIALTTRAGSDETRVGVVGSDRMYSAVHSEAVQLRAASATTTTSTTVATTTTVPVPTTSPAPPPVTTVPPPQPHAAEAVAGCGGWDLTIAAYFPPGEQAKACSVMMCESQGNPAARNPRSTASGLWQFLDSTWRATTGRSDRAFQASPDEQTAAAAALWRSSGWQPWVCA